MKLNLLSIRGRFLMITSVLLVILIFFGWFIIGIIGDLSAITEKINNHPLEVSNAASYANVEVVRMHRDLKDIILVEEDYEVNIIVDNIRVSESNVYVALDSIEFNILGEEGKQLQYEARVLFDDWKSIRSKIIELVRVDKYDEAIDITRHEGADHIQLLERKLIDLNQYARQKADEFQTESNELKSNSETLAIVGTVIVFVIILVSILWLSMNVLGGITKLGNSMNEIVESGEFKSIALVGEDELGALSQIFNKLIQELGSRLWVKDGGILLNSQLMTSNHTEDDIQNYIEKLNDYSGLLSTAYYNVDNNHLNLVASINRLRFMDSEYAIGEHIVGECALMGKSRTITYGDASGITNSEELPFTEIRLTPIMYNEIVYGVLETVKKDSSSLVVDELIYETSKDLGAYIAASEQRKKIDALLKESIKANEQLTSRQIRLEENTDELEAANRTLQEQRDLLNVKSIEQAKQNQELTHLREELVTKYKDLEEVTLYRSQFLTNISHELKTPLNSIIVLSSILEKKVDNIMSDKDKDQVMVIHKAGNELLSIINDILDLSKVESGKVELYEEVFDTSYLINEYKVIYNTVISEKGLDANFVDSCSTKIYADKAKINHIITNFISNAIKFTKEGGITVTLESLEDINYPMKISVTDTGIGIDKEKLEVIFDEFVQSDGSISRLYGGTGLGLAICRNYANLINAKIEVASEKNIGSTFTLKLPSAILLDEYGLGADDANSVEEVYVNKSSLKPEHRDKTILICDDEPMNVFALSSMLEDIGINPIATLSGEECLKVLKENPNIDMVFMDYMMPEMDGFETVVKINEIPENKGIPITIITAANLNSKEIEFIKKEECSYIKKPIIYNSIVDILNEKLK